MNNATKAIVYREEYMGQGGASLVVKQMNKIGTDFALIGYTPAGYDIAPIVFARGSLDDCRKMWKQAKACVPQWIGKDYTTK